jgi:hypothetical protein
MIHCKDCEFFRRDEQGRVSFACDPFSTVKEPECLTKWHILKTDQMVQAYHATLSYYRRLGPMQEKMFKVLERELDDINESESWKASDEEEDNGLPDKW